MMVVEPGIARRLRFCPSDKVEFISKEFHRCTDSTDLSLNYIIIIIIRSILHRKAEVSHFIGHIFQSSEVFNLVISLHHGMTA